MRDDPLDARQKGAIRVPPLRGPGSGKDAWVRFGRECADNNRELWNVINEQSETIRELRAEIQLLRNQIARRKPKGARERLNDQTIRQIELELASGRYSRRGIAIRNGVSAMTVTRVARRVAAREVLWKVDHHG